MGRKTEEEYHHPTPRGLLITEEYKMRALVTGGGGFLGSGIAKSLHEKQHDVTVVGRHHYSHLPRGIKQFQGDIRNFDFLRKIIVGMDAVFHTAAFPGIWGRRSEERRVGKEGRARWAPYQ